jgi:hypothetical protein
MFAIVPGLSTSNKPVAESQNGLLVAVLTGQFGNYGKID